jgi:predicted enzyme related to lactoylglutathione lyase
MANRHGDFIWYELLTSDPAAAERFYGPILGWRARRAEGSPVEYHIFGTGEAEVAGLMAIPPDAGAAGMRPGWLGYIGVDDVDAAAAAILAAGGGQHVPPTDIPGVGRFALVADPQGIPFYVMRGTMECTSTSFAPTRTGHCHWNELTTTDQEAALGFYTGQFGWQRGDAMPMGELGEYCFITHHEAPMGAVMTRMPDGPPPAWNFYFGVADIDIAAEAARGASGTVHYGPTEVPGGTFIIIGSDPQGAMFGLVGSRRAPG